ncbi:rhamnosyltransferase [Idiomarina fontislapidosi]|uniref:Glycosyl transferase n=1 Tax=Idiomarina fontislapidosi TaxID=263723 RepID=A0A432XFU9_9GAMM|nr:glycosyltransferase [Idiomarina fontislapidosi]PYE30105.1 rhamnosyltransferase [Idiomarina fontislapidosi]RUO47595.1 glycosyl transferase [Idiomarina fontislapidosi]
MEVKKLPRIAVLLAAYNGEQWIESQIYSILNQERVEVVIYVSLDLSTDSTKKLIENFVKQYDNVKLLPYGEHFGGAAANFFNLFKVVDFNGFDAVSLADQDDIWLSNKLAVAYRSLDEKKFDVYSSSVVAVWKSGKEKFINKAHEQKKIDHFFEPAGPGCTYVFNISSAKSLQDFIRNSELVFDIHLHDWLAYAYCREKGFKWFIDESSYIRYRQHDSNQFGVNFGLKAYLKRFRLISSKWYREQVLKIVLLVAPEKYNKINKRSYLLLNFNEVRRRRIDQFILLFLVLFKIY